MSRKSFTQILVLGLLLAAFLAVPASVQAGGMCGGKYTVDAGDTLNSIAARCGISVSAITSANPGVADPLKAGQTLTLPVGTNAGGVTSSIVSSDSTYTTTNTNTTINNTYVAPVTYNNGTYIVQYGDTFSAIAARYGLTINQLWAANPQIWNINYVYAGQPIYIPSSGGYVGSYTPISEMEPSSYGNVPSGAPYGTVKLINKSSGDAYISFQGNTNDGIRVIYEYPVTKSTRVKMAAGSYTYVAWVNQKEFVGYIDLNKLNTQTITFRDNGVTAQ